MTAQAVDLIVEVDAALPMTDRAVLYDTLIAVDGGRILYIGDRETGRRSYQSSIVIGGPGTVALPGLVNAHTHVGLHFFGTLCDDVNVINSLYDLIFPMEAGFDEELMHAASSLGLWDAVRGGVTTICDHYHFADATARAARRIGVRGLVADKIIEFTLDDPPRYDSGTQRYSIRYKRAEAERRLATNIDFVERWKGDPLITPCLGPHAPDTLSTEMLTECARAADDLDVKMLMHVAQSRAEIAQIASKGYSGSIYYLSEIGFLSPRVQAAHMVYLDEPEIGIAGASGMGMSFNPVIMMACHSFPKIDRLLASGIRAGMGTDCLSMDQLEDMRYGIYMANYVRGPAGFQMTGYDLLRLATVGGAQCLGLADEIGTLETGKKADLIVLDLKDGQLVPNTNYFESIAYYAKSRNLAHSVINGRLVYSDGRLQLADQDEIYAEGTKHAHAWLRRNQAILERTGLLERLQSHARATLKTTSQKHTPLS
jgi:5-methylthioadenosine/S-adenosylhomocysteine deaminase